jgi:amidase
LADLTAFNKREAQIELAYFGQERFEQAARRGPLTNPDYLEVKERLLRLTRVEGIDAVMDEHRLDAIVAPSTGPARLIDLVNGDAGSGSSAGVPAIAGYPHVTVPMGAVAGLPVGLSFFVRGVRRCCGASPFAEQATCTGSRCGSLHCGPCVGLPPPRQPAALL